MLGTLFQLLQSVKNNKSCRLTRGRGIGQWAEALIDTGKENILVIMDMVGKCFL